MNVVFFFKGVASIKIEGVGKEGKKGREEEEGGRRNYKIIYCGQEGHQRQRHA